MGRTKGDSKLSERQWGHRLGWENEGKLGTQGNGKGSKGR